MFYTSTSTITRGCTLWVLSDTCWLPICVVKIIDLLSHAKERNSLLDLIQLNLTYYVLDFVTECDAK